MSNLSIDALRHADLSRLLSSLAALIEPRPVPLADWRDEVLGRYATHHTNTRGRMRQALSELLALAGDRATTQDLTPALFDRFAARGGRASTVNGLLASLRAALRACDAPGRFPSGLLESCRFRIPDRDAPRQKHHATADVARVLTHLERAATDWASRRLFTLASVYAFLGLRRTEALRLKVADVDLERGFVFVRPNGRALKTHASEAPVPIPDALTPTLRAWVADAGSEWLFPGLKGSGPWVGGTSGKTAGAAIRAAGEACGVKGFTPRSLRHTLATHLAGRHGLGPKQVQMVLRHSRETTQAHYVHPDLVNLRDAVRTFGYTPTPPATPTAARRRPSLIPRKFPARRRGPCGLSPPPR